VREELAVRETRKRILGEETPKPPDPEEDPEEDQVEDQEEEGDGEDGDE
jgi:hypothetical protein